MIRWLRALVACPHETMLRETRDGRRYFTCAHCGFSQPQIGRDEPLTVMAPAHERMVAQRQPAQVVRLPQRRRQP